MADEVKVQDAMQSDFSVVVDDIAEELLTRLNMDEDGSVIDMFQTGSFDPWQLFVFFGALEKALVDFRTDKRKKTVIVHAQPEALIGIWSRGNTCIYYARTRSNVSLERHERRSSRNWHAYSICWQHRLRRCKFKRSSRLLSYAIL